MGIKREVKTYTRGTIDVAVFFPNGDICCKWCQFLKNEQYYDRNLCRLTNEYIISPKTVIGDNCPLKFDEEG